MTFKDVVWKNFMGNVKQYLSYFLCSTFTITIFFMYSIMLFNDGLGGEEAEVLRYVFPIAMVAIALFSIFFITYAHNSFIKARNKEFGVYITLGMDLKELKKMVNLENAFICGCSLVSGMLIGTLFSRLFQMVILSMLEIEDIKYMLSYKAFVLTLAVFLAIFAFVFGLTSLKMNRMDITSLLQEVRKSEGKEYTKKDSVLGFFGILILVVSAFLIKPITNNSKLCTSPLSLLSFAAPAFLGTYLTLSFGGNYIVHLVKRTSFYQKHLLEVSEVHYKFARNQRIIFILSILSAMTVIFVASPFSLFRLSAKIADDGSHDVEYAEYAGHNELSEDEINQLLEKSGAEVTNVLDVPFLFLYQSQDNTELTNTRVVMSVSQYNELLGTDYVVEAGHAINVHANWQPGTFGVEVGHVHTLYAGDESFDFIIQESGRGKWIVEMNTFPNPSTFIVNDGDYQQIYEVIQEKGLQSSMMGSYHLFDFKNWLKEEKVVDLFHEKLQDELLPMNSVLDTYLGLKNGYGVFLFVCTVLGILFFVAGGGVLYFKQFTELGEARRTFRKLFKIGVTQREVKRFIGNELKVVFFLPLIFGAFIGIGLIYIMTFFVGGDYVIDEFMKNAWVVIVLYFISQNLFYFITKRKYVSEVIKEK